MRHSLEPLSRPTMQEVSACLAWCIEHREETQHQQQQQSAWATVSLAQLQVMAQKHREEMSIVTRCVEEAEERVRQEAECDAEADPQSGAAAGSSSMVSSPNSSSSLLFMQEKTFVLLQQLLARDLGKDSHRQGK